MPKNLEMKIPLSELRGWGERLARLGAQFVRTVRQTDTYFIVDRGRLKLRETGGGGAELIFYDRDEAKGARWSDYHVVPVPDAGSVKLVLSKALGTKVTVEKRRDLYLFENARIHIDRVAQLGDFLEFEVMVVDTAEGAVQLLEFLLENLSLKGIEPIKVSYCDLLLRNAGGVSVPPPTT